MLAKNTRCIKWNKPVKEVIDHTAEEPKYEYCDYMLYIKGCYNAKPLTQEDAEGLYYSLQEALFGNQKVTA